jgi:hypothetical protein
MLRRALFIGLVVSTTGCDMISSWFQQDVALPVTLTSPPQTIDVTQPVSDAETQACTDKTSDACTAITAICKTDATDTTCDTNPTIPAEFPAQVTIAGQSEDANQAMATMGITKATEIKLALPVDVASALADQGVQSPAAIKKVGISKVVMQWPSNTLTFDAPPLDIYVTTDDIGSGPVDVASLISQNKVQKVGTIGLDTNGDGVVDIGQHAGGTDDVPLNFVSGGSDILTKAVTSAKFTVVTAVPDGKGMKLGQKPGDASTDLKPGGVAKVQLQATLEYTVSAADIVGGVKSATGQ